MTRVVVSRLQVITILSDDGENGGELFLADGDGPNAAMISMEVIDALLYLARHSTDLADSIGQMIVDAAEAVKRTIFTEA